MILPQSWHFETGALGCGLGFGAALCGAPPVKLDELAPNEEESAVSDEGASPDFLENGVPLSRL